MSKYTMSLEDYVLSRYYAKKLAEDPSIDWPQVMHDLDEEPSIAYEIIAEEVLPDLTSFLYSNDESIIADFVAGFVDQFYFCEIGQETMARFKWTLRAYFRNTKDKWRQLFDAQLRSFADALNMTDYKRVLHDALKRTGNETTAVQHGKSTAMNHGLTATTTPGRVQTNKIIPLGGSVETELNQSSESGSETLRNTGTDTTTDSGTDTTTRTPNTLDDRWSQEEYSGYMNADKLAQLEKFRALILDINSMIYEDIKKNHLFMEVW